MRQCFFPCAQLLTAATGRQAMSRSAVLRGGAGSLMRSPSVALPAACNLPLVGYQVGHLRGLGTPPAPVLPSSSASLQPEGLLGAQVATAHSYTTFLQSLWRSMRRASRDLQKQQQQ